LFCVNDDCLSLLNSHFVEGRALRYDFGVNSATGLKRWQVTSASPAARVNSMTFARPPLGAKAEAVADVRVFLCGVSRANLI
jgi:hypothetical protein